MDKQCENCDLHKTRTKIVFGEGSLNARVMFIGEAPGRLEDETGSPFVGRSGKLLREVMNENGLQSSHVYITNIVKCRPPDNRTPSNGEITSCLPNLMEEILNIDPDLIVFVGRTSAHGVTKMNVNMDRDSGSTFDWNNRKCMVIYHPGWIIRALNVRRLIIEREMSKIVSILTINKEPRGLERWI